MLAIAFFDLWSAVIALVGHFTHHDYSVHVLHSHHFWVNLFFDLVIVAFAETIVAALAGLVVRRRFDRDARVARTVILSEPLAAHQSR